MIRRALTLVILGALALSGCSAPQVASFEDKVGGAIARVQADIALLNNALAKAAGNDIPAACGIVRVAEGYFADVAPLIPANTRKVEAQAAAAVKVICDNPPQDIQQAFTDLNNAWAAIQAATTVPGT